MPDRFNDSDIQLSADAAMNAAIKKMESLIFAVFAQKRFFLNKGVFYAYIKTTAVKDQNNRLYLKNAPTNFKVNMCITTTSRVPIDSYLLSGKGFWLIHLGCPAAHKKG